MRHKWTEEELDFLRDKYSVGDWNAIFERFPNVTKGSIQCVCSKNDIRFNNKTSNQNIINAAKNRKKWTQDEEQIIIKYYSEIPIDEITPMLPQRSRDAIILRANALKILSFEKLQQLWTDSDKEFISKNWMTMSDKDISIAINRTQRSIKWMREKLGLFRQEMGKCSYESISKFIRGRIQDWKNKSMKACNYKCVFTENKAFEIHHIVSLNIIISEYISLTGFKIKENFSDYTKDELESFISDFIPFHDKYPLGMCISKEIHQLYHSLYGDNNDMKQWESFYNNYKNNYINVQ